MSQESFQYRLSLTAPLITKQVCRSRISISPAERLVITPHYLAAGDSQQSQSVSFHSGRATVFKIVKETYEAIWSVLDKPYMQPPASQSQWKKFPKVLGTSGISLNAWVL